MMHVTADASEKFAPVSLAQRRLWFLAQMKGASEAYHMSSSWRLRGPLDRDALRCALDRIIVRHEALRTTFATNGGEPLQRISDAPGLRFLLLEHDLRGRSDPARALGEIVDEEMRAPFHLESWPLVRGRLIRTAGEEHVLLVTMHHIVCDGWSQGVFASELGLLYTAFASGAEDPLSPLTVHYCDYSARQRERLTPELLDSQAKFWQKRLAGVPELLALPTDYERPEQQDYRGQSLEVQLDAEEVARLRRLGKRRRVTLYVVLMSAWAAVLARLTGQTDLVIGTPMANRTDEDLDGLIGCFVNTVALRLEISNSITVAELLNRAGKEALDVREHQNIPFEQVVEAVRPARNAAYTPLFQTMFAWQSGNSRTPDLKGLEVCALSFPQHSVARFDLTLSAWQDGPRIQLKAEYAGALFRDATTSRYLTYYRNFLRAMADDDSQRIGRIDILTPEERNRQIREWGANPQIFREEHCVQQLFQSCAHRNPDSIAIVFEDSHVSYGELNQHANKLARYLRRIGAGPDARVAICVDRTPAMVVGLLAAIKAGSAYVPLDPAYPPERLQHMLDDSEPSALLATGESTFRFNGPVVDVAGMPAPWLDESGGDLDINELGLTGQNLAYVMYTSGSTGTPKGVMVTHEALCNLVQAQIEAFSIRKTSAVLQFASISFDACASEIFTALCAGAALHLIRREQARNAMALTAQIAQLRSTHATLPPVVLETLAEPDDLSAIEVLISAGEKLSGQLAARWSRNRQLLNAYGPTEGTVCATIHEYGAGHRPDCPIGRPMANARIYLLNDALEPVPTGATGEIFIGGAGVARGYLRRPDLTAERFIPDPFAPHGCARMYRTGDLGRWTSDGVMEFLGRNDLQIKIRGFRVELAEIEARLGQHPAVEQAVVAVREDTPGTRRIVAYYKSRREGGVTPGELSAHLQAMLPDYMIPVAYVPVTSFPLTSNGKVHRRALSAPENTAFARQTFEPPIGDVETTLASIWEEALKVAPLGRHDNFFRLGGHSLLAVKVFERMRQNGLAADVAAIFVTPTVAGLAAACSRQVTSAEAPPNPIPQLPPRKPERSRRIELRL